MGILEHEPRSKHPAVRTAEEHHRARCFRGRTTKIVVFCRKEYCHVSERLLDGEELQILVVITSLAEWQSFPIKSMLEEDDEGVVLLCHLEDCACVIVEI